MPLQNASKRTSVRNQHCIGSCRKYMYNFFFKFVFYINTSKLKSNSSSTTHIFSYFLRIVRNGVNGDGRICGRKWSNAMFACAVPRCEGKGACDVRFVTFICIPAHGHHKIYIHTYIHTYVHLCLSVSLSLSVSRGCLPPVSLSVSLCLCPSLSLSWLSPLPVWRHNIDTVFMENVVWLEPKC